MKGSNIASAIQHLKLAQEHFEDFKREHPGTKGATLFGVYSRRIEWILKDMITHTHLPENVRQGIKREVNSDLFTIIAIHEKIALLPPAQRDLIETAIDEYLNLNIKK